MSRTDPAHRLILRSAYRDRKEPTTEPRIPLTKYSLEALRALYALERHVKASGLPESLIHLIKMRVSQINGCAYCLDMHFKDARAIGDTLVAETHVSDEVYERVRKEFSEQELVEQKKGAAAS